MGKNRATLTALGCLAVSQAMGGFNWSSGTFWTSPYTGNWNSVNWSKGLPNKDTDMALGYSGENTTVPFSGRLEIRDFAASARNVKMRGTVNMRNAQLDIYGDVDGEGGGGFELSSSRLFATTSSNWNQVFTAIKSGTNYLEVWTGQTLTLDSQSWIFSVGSGDLIQSRVLYRPGSIVNEGTILLYGTSPSDPINLELTGKLFSNVGSISATGFDGEVEVNLAYEEVQSPGYIDAYDNSVVNIYASDDSKPMVFGSLLASTDGTINIHANKIKFGERSWAARWDGSINLYTSEVDAGVPGSGDPIRLLNKSKFKHDNYGSIVLRVKDGETGLIKGGQVHESSIRLVRSQSPQGGVPTRLYKTEFLDAFTFSNNEFIFDQCTLSQLNVKAGRFEIRNYNNVSNAWESNEMITVVPWGLYESWWYSLGDINLQGVLDVQGPLVLANRGSDPVKFINKSSLSVQAPITATPKATLVNDGGFVNVLGKGDLPDMVSKNGGSVDIAQHRGITGALTAESSSMVTILAPSVTGTPGAPFEGFARGLNIKAGATLTLDLGTVKPSTTFMKSSGVTLGGTLTIIASGLPTQAPGTAIDVIQGPTVFGSGISISPVPGWTVTSSPIGIWITKN